MTAEQQSDHADLPCTVAGYLVDQLRIRCNIRHIFGVPGDFSFGINDAIAEKHIHHDADQRVQWIGTLNELIGAYAADGYARVNGFGVVNTAYTVGELSAINAIAGSFAHKIPVMHIAGMPEEHLWSENELPPHHSLGEGHPDPHVTVRAIAPYTVAAVCLDSPEGARQIIDDMISWMILTRRPVSIAIPRDVCRSQASLISLNETTTVLGFFDRIRALLLPEHLKMPAVQLALKMESPIDDAKLEALADSILSILSTGEDIEDCADPLDALPMIVVGSQIDHLANTQIKDAILRLITALRLPTASFLDGKGFFKEEGNEYLGVIAAMLSGADSPAMTALESGILDGRKVLAIGCVFGDLNPGIAHIYQQCIHLDQHCVTIAREQTSGVSLPVIVDKLIDRIQTGNYSVASDTRLHATIQKLRNGCSRKADIQATDNATESLDGSSFHSDSIQDALQNMIKPEDLVFVETGTMLCGVAVLRIPLPHQMETQSLYCSIGWALPATFGAAIARQIVAKPPNRVILLTGEGSAMMTIQALTLFLHDTNIGPVTIMNVDNAGYTIEKLLTDTPDEVHLVYNDLPPINYVQLAKAFGPSDIEERWDFKEITDTNDLERIVAAGRNTTRSHYWSIKIPAMCVPSAAAGHGIRFKAREVSKQ